MSTIGVVGNFGPATGSILEFTYYPPTNASVGTTHPRINPYTLRVNPTAATSNATLITRAASGAGGAVNLTSGNTSFVRFYLWIGTLPGSNAFIYSEGLDSNGWLPGIALRLNTTGTLSVMNLNYGSALATSALALSTGQWYYIELSHTIQSASGSYTLKINGSSQASGSGANFNAGQQGYMFGDRNTSQTFDIYFCDFLARDDSAPGDGSVYLLPANANGNYVGTWTFFGGSQVWSSTNEVPNDGDTSYATVSTANAKFSTTTAGGVPSSATINAVTSLNISRHTGIVNNILPFVRSNGTDDSGAAWALTSSYNGYSKYYTNDPHTSAPWTVGAVNALEGGAVSGASAASVRTTAAYILVDYLLPATPGTTNPYASAFGKKVPEEPGMPWWSLPGGISPFALDDFPYSNKTPDTRLPHFVIQHFQGPLSAMPGLADGEFGVANDLGHVALYVGMTGVNVLIGPVTEMSGSTGLVLATPTGASGKVSLRALAGTDLPSTAVTPGTYGDATHISSFTVDATGRITAASNIAITVPTGANPTASVGLIAVNGSATTFLRSDGAPPISQSIVPTWTGLHTFNGGATVSGAFTQSGGNYSFNTAAAGTASISIGNSSTLTLGGGSSSVCQFSFTSISFTASTTLTIGGSNTTTTLDGVTLNIGTANATAINIAYWASTQPVTTIAGKTSGFGVRGHCNGYQMSCTSTTTTLTLTAGDARNSTDLINIAGTLTSKVLGNTWASGGGSNGLDTGTVAASTWYHVYAILNDTTGVGDILFSLSASSPTMPTGYTFFRRIGAILADASKNITQFIQLGDFFMWTNGLPTDFSLSITAGTSQLGTISVPTGVKVEAVFNIASSAIGNVLVTSPDAKDETVQETGPVRATFQAALANGNCWHRVWTNTSAQVRVNSNVTATFKGSATGWYDYRGKDF